jgi:hypothetical protein
MIVIKGFLNFVVIFGEDFCREMVAELVEA